MGTEIKSLTPKYSTSNIKAPLRFENIAKILLWIDVTFRVVNGKIRNKCCRVEANLQDGNRPTSS